MRIAEYNNHNARQCRHSGQFSDGNLVRGRFHLPAVLMDKVASDS